MSLLISPFEDGSDRPLDSNVSRPMGTVQTHPVAGGTAAAPTVEVGDRLPTLRVRVTDAQPNASAASLALDATGVSHLVLALLSLVAGLIRSRHSVPVQADALAHGRLPGDLLALIGALVRGALAGCPQAHGRRRDYAMALLPTLPGLVAANGNVRVVSCALTADGYDVLVVGPDGATMVMSIALPAHLIDDVCATVLDLAGKVLTAPSQAEAERTVRDLINGRIDRPLTDAIAIAVFAALNASPDLPDDDKTALCGSDSVYALTSRI